MNHPVCASPLFYAGPGSVSTRRTLLSSLT